MTHTTPVSMYVVATGLALLGGCVWPVPPGNITLRRDIGTEVPSIVVPGATTRADVLLALGMPDNSDADERELHYRTVRSTAGVMVFAGTSFGLRGTSFRELIVRFDEDGVVRDARVETGTCDSNERCRAWLRGN